MFGNNKYNREPDPEDQLRGGDRGDLTDVFFGSLHHEDGGSDERYGGLHDGNGSKVEWTAQNLGGLTVHETLPEDDLPPEDIKPWW